MDYSTIESKIKNYEHRIIDTKRANSVLIPLIEGEGGVCLLFEQRSMKVWQPGEVCFPGGGIESKESAEEAAIRETSEELGLDKSKITILNQFDTVVGLGGFVIHSFIGKLCIDFEEIKKLPYDKDEVGEIFSVPIQWFIDNKPKEYAFPLKIEVPGDFDYSVFGVDGPYNWRQSQHTVISWKYENHYIWGLTAKIIKAFIESIS